MRNDVNVVVIDLTVNEAVTENDDGSYTIFINARLSAEGQKNAYEHAMKHIDVNDFEKTNVQEIECVAHGISFDYSDTDTKQHRENSRTKKT